MSVCISSRSCRDCPCQQTPRKNAIVTTPFQETSRQDLTIGLINNMPDGALEATERQFGKLLDAASDGRRIRLLLYSMPGIPRNKTAQQRVEEFYLSTDCLGDRPLDALIVTGREPTRADLAEEPYWGEFTKIVEWARENTYSTIWSCLAAHAAVLYLDGINRIKGDRKHCGILGTTRVSEHPLLGDVPERYCLPHSRWNGVQEEALGDGGYTVLTRAGKDGVDTWIKQYQSLFVYFQGHPEYEADSLLLEYRRDVSRYLKGESNTYPYVPAGYLDHGTTVALTELQHAALLRPRVTLMAEVSAILANAKVEHAWDAVATRLYRNWITYSYTRKLRNVIALPVPQAVCVPPNAPAAEIIAFP
jgi:homoserine O-succinyltransferase/O-acetyltransferase